MNTLVLWKDWKTWLEIVFLLVTLIGLAIPLGLYIAKVYQGQPLWVDKLLKPIEKGLYKISWVNPQEQMGWQDYSKSVMALGIISFIILFLLLRVQYYLPLNPQHYLGVQPDLAFNISISFLTNTNWQSYEGEKVLSYFSQMMGLTVQQFISAATGMAVAAAFIRGIVSSSSTFLGNFWVDVVRGVLYILLPLSFIMAILLNTQGVIQNFHDYLIIPSMDINSPTQVIPGGPVASQEAIKLLGSNGGGFFGANSAHPFENPSPFSNFLGLLSMLLIPVSFILAYGKMVHQPKQSIALLSMLLLVLILGFLCCSILETSNGMLNYAGKEYRHGIFNSTLWTVIATASSNGSMNALIDSFQPLAGMIPLLFMLTGEVILGGVGQGLYSLILYIFITMFIAGLMAGRMPAYLGKKIEVFEVKMAMLAILIPAMTILIFSSISVYIPITYQSISQIGGKGLTELFYAFTSTTINNGSGFASFNANTPFFNIVFGLNMLIGRYGVIFPVLAIAGSLTQKISIVEQNNHIQHVSIISTDTVIFVVLILSVILFVSLLSFLPALFMGPIAEQLAGLQR